MWLQTGENTVDCLISYSVVATTDVPLAKKTVAKTKHVSGCKPCRILAIAPLAQCDYKKTVAKKHVIAIATKKQLQKTQVKKCGCKKPLQKKAPCH
jgi:hypothetical protein